MFIHGGIVAPSASSRSEMEQGAPERARGRPDQLVRTRTWPIWFPIAVHGTLGTQRSARSTTSVREEVAKREERIMNTTGFQHISKTAGCGRSRFAAHYCCAH
jgi:hypothetical protein